MLSPAKALIPESSSSVFAVASGSSHDFGVASGAGFPPVPSAPVAGAGPFPWPHADIPPRINKKPSRRMPRRRRAGRFAALITITIAIGPQHWATPADPTEDETPGHPSPMVG